MNPSLAILELRPPPPPPQRSRTILPLLSLGGSATEAYAAEQSRNTHGRGDRHSCDRNIATPTSRGPPHTVVCVCVYELNTKDNTLTANRRSSSGAWRRSMASNTIVAPTAAASATVYGVVTDTRHRDNPFVALLQLLGPMIPGFAGSAAPQYTTTTDCDLSRGR